MLRTPTATAFLRIPLFALAIAAAFAPAPAPAQDGPADAPSVQTPAQPQPILTVDKLKIGMKGYGMTVFQGDTIEPFPIEVISVMRDFGPKRSVIWIRCPDPRLQKTGPVSGMSGSPIYVWEDGKEGEIGKGGKLIGAFAYGYSWTKDCYAGVQPIELMRESASRVDAKAGDHVTARATGASFKSTLRRLLAGARRAGMSERETWRARALAQLGGAGPDADQAIDEETTVPAPESLGGFARPMPLPMAVSTPGAAELLEPLLAPMGIQPMESPPGTGTGFPPPGVERAEVRIAPGSVLAIPLAWGDLDLSATGTVTDVLPDGRVLGFGHAMFGQGESAVPLASGYVHFIVPRLAGSFKLGGSATIRGAIVRDENSAVVGVPGVTFDTAPVNITVTKPDQPKRSYKYQVIKHEQLTPTLAAITAMESVAADQGLPTINTLRITGKMVFEGDRELTLDSLTAGGSTNSLIMQVLPPMATMAQNSHDPVYLKSLDLNIVVEEEARGGAIVGARLDSVDHQPGDTVGVNLQIQPYYKPIVRKRIELKLPESLPDGQYQVFVVDGQNYQRLLMQNRPHLLQTKTADDVFEYVKRIVSIPNDTLFAVMQLPDPGLAVGRQELPGLPSSKRALIATPTSTLATEYFDWLEAKAPMGMAISGQLSFTIKVERDPAQ